MMIGKGKKRCSPSASIMFGGSKQQSGRNYRGIIQCYQVRYLRAVGPAACGAWGEG